MARGMHRLLLVPILLLVAMPADAGTVRAPEILDAPDDTRQASPDRNVIPQIDIMKAWIQPSGKDLVFAIQTSAAETIPAKAVYVWHFTPESPSLKGAARFFFRMNWSADQSALEYFGGVYQGAKGGFDENGNTRYDYFRGNDNSDIRGSFEPGSPATIKFRYPAKSFGDDVDQLFIKGLFVTTYLRGTEDALVMMDYAAAPDGKDYKHEVKDVPWYQDLPGPSTGLIVLSGLVMLAVADRKLRGAR